MTRVFKDVLTVLVINKFSSSLSGETLLAIVEVIRVFKDVLTVLLMNKFSSVLPEKKTPLLVLVEVIRVFKGVLTVLVMGKISALLTGETLLRTWIIISAVFEYSGERAVFQNTDITSTV